MFKLRVFDIYEKFSYHVIGPTLRHSGKALAQFGLRIQGSLGADDRRNFFKFEIDPNNH